MCETASGCDTKTGCEGDVCGPFRITWGYWADADKLTLNGEDPNKEGGKIIKYPKVIFKLKIRFNLFFLLLIYFFFSLCTLFK